jgi:hypothetical protein
VLNDAEAGDLWDGEVFTLVLIARCVARPSLWLVWLLPDLCASARSVALPFPRAMCSELANRAPPVAAARSVAWPFPRYVVVGPAPLLH